MAHPRKDDDARPLQAVGRVLDSRWMMALAVAAVLVAIVWALLDKGLKAAQYGDASRQGATATVELLGVPAGAEVSLDGRRIENTRFAVSPETRHLLEVVNADGRSWRQVFRANGSLSLVVELRTYFVEVEVPPTDRKSKE
jgi:peptidoglycan/LPS O-acetylase OafA/YrhL